ncbi:hypothetical protein BCR36DRAFT_416398 [Piromyces finnis]|uniref:Uncharacterized protein n=1 Tax=Piromyces finnis TaxID=1754191 RepID=A0A1Y1UVD2_9FUNG|nr:hypothetical protein BCR36DRAFT_416398 [Piromyces finnis]|eukprot:ORX41994.1 hypothetical protein BCR36DRAFT_416398 [Piromyces finnis]
MANISMVNESENTAAIQITETTVVNNPNKSQISILLNPKGNSTKENIIPKAMASSPINIEQNHSKMENIKNFLPKEEEGNSYSYSNKNIDASSPIAIQPPPPPTALNQFSYNPKASNAFLSSADNNNSIFSNSKSSSQLEQVSSYQSDQNINIKEGKTGSSSLVSPSNVHLLPQDNLYSQSYQPTLTRDITNGITGNILSSSFTYKNHLLANVNTNTARKANVSFTKGIPICENTFIKSQRMHRKRTMRLTKQAQNEVGLFYSFDADVLLQISVEQWIDFITITTFFLWQHPNIHPSDTFIDEVYDAIGEADTKEKNYFFAYRRFIYQFMIKTSPNPFVILYAIVYLFKLREGIPNDVVTPRSETFVFPVLVMMGDKFIQDVHQLPAKYWAKAAKMDTDDLIMFQRKIIKYLGYSLLVNYDEIDNVVTLLEEFIQKDVELDTISKDRSTTSSNSYPTPPTSQQSSVDFAFSMYNENIDSTNPLDAKEAEILIYTFRKVLNEQEEYIPTVIILPKHNKKPTIVVDGKKYVEGENERDTNGHYFDPSPMTSKKTKSVPIGHAKLSTSAPKSSLIYDPSLSISSMVPGRSKRLSAGLISVSPYSLKHRHSYNSNNLSNDNSVQHHSLDPSYPTSGNCTPRRRSMNDPFYVYEGIHPYHTQEDLEFKKYTSGGGKKVSMLSKAMNLLKNDKNKKVSKNAHKNASFLRAPSLTLPRNFKSSKFNTKANSTNTLHEDRDDSSPFLNQPSYSESQVNYTPYLSKGSHSGSKRNSRSLAPQSNRNSICTTVSNTSQNKRYSLPLYNVNPKFNGSIDTCYSNPPDTQPQKISIINKKTDGSVTPEDYLFKDHSVHPQNFEVSREKVTTVKLNPKRHSSSAPPPQIVIDDKCQKIDDTQGSMLENPLSFSEDNLKEGMEQRHEEVEDEGEKQKSDDYIEYTQAVNMLKSIPFGDDAFVKSMEDDIIRQEDTEDVEGVADFVKSNSSGLKTKSSNFLFSKRKNILKSGGSHGTSLTLPEENGYVKKHSKSKSLFTGSNGYKKNISVGKKFYTLGHNRSENSINNSYFSEKDIKYSQDPESTTHRIEGEKGREEEEKEKKKEEREENEDVELPLNGEADIYKSNSYPKRNGSNKSLKWFGKIMKSIQLKK